MDASRFDRLSKSFAAQRRTVLGGLLAGVLLPLEAAARGKGRQEKQRTGRGKDGKHARAQEEPCWRAGSCIPGKGSNVSRCDLSRYTTFPSADCTGCNLSRTNMRGVDASGVTFTRANLSGACLVGVDFTGATFKNTNLANATFCRTIMSDGTVDNSGCGNDTACCPTAECLASNEGAPCDEGSGICRASVCTRAAHTCICGDESQPTGCIQPSCTVQGPGDLDQVEALCLQLCADRGGFSGEYLCRHVEVCPL